MAAAVATAAIDLKEVRANVIPSVLIRPAATGATRAPTARRDASGGVGADRGV